MSAPLLTLDRLRARFAQDLDGLADFADDLAARFATSSNACSRAPLKEAALDLLAHCPDPSGLPLWGVPYVVAANVDVIGLPTSIGVPALDFQPDFDATVVERLRAAGALLVGKVPAEPFGADISAQEAAASVASGIAAFGIASDRGAAIAAADYGVAAILPARDLLSTEGVFAIAPELEGLAIFSADIASGAALRGILESTPEVVELQATAPLRFGFLGDDKFEAALAIADQLGATTVMVDDAPFAELADLMEQDVWLAFKLDDIALPFMELPELFPPVLRGRLSRIFGLSAPAQIRAQRHLSNLCRQVEATLSRLDLLFLPPAANLGGFISACGLTATILPDGGTLVGHGGRGNQIDALAPFFTAAKLRAANRPVDILSSSPLAHR